MMNQDEVEQHMAQLKRDEQQLAEQLLIVRGALRNSEVILGLAKLPSASETEADS